MTGYKLAKLIVDHGGMVIGTDVNPHAIQRAVGGTRHQGDR